MTLSQNLKKLRQNIGYTQQQVADALNIERSTYTYYETGKTTPDISTIIKLSKIFNVSYVDILENEDINRNRVRDASSEQNMLQKNSIITGTFDLTKKEKTLLACFRVLPEEFREELISQALNKVSELKKKK